MKIEEHIIPKVLRFRFIGSILQRDREIDGMSYTGFKIGEWNAETF